MLKIGSVVTLSNKQKYVVTYVTNLNGEEYCYIINSDNDRDSMICKLLPNENLEVVNDSNTINLFLRTLNNYIKRES